MPSRSRNRRMQRCLNSRRARASESSAFARDPAARFCSWCKGLEVAVANRSSSSSGEACAPEDTSDACSSESRPCFTACSVFGCSPRRLLVASRRRAAPVLEPVLAAMSSSGDLAPLRFHAADSS